MLKKEFLADLICYGKIVVELKAQDNLSGKEEAQIINYLKATGNDVGLLINFGASSLEHRRFAFTQKRSLH